MDQATCVRRPRVAEVLAEEQALVQVQSALTSLWSVLLLSIAHPCLRSKSSLFSSEKLNSPRFAIHSKYFLGSYSIKSVTFRVELLHSFRTITL